MKIAHLIRYNNRRFPVRNAQARESEYALSSLYK